MYVSKWTLVIAVFEGQHTMLCVLIPCACDLCLPFQSPIGHCFFFVVFFCLIVLST